MIQSDFLTRLKRGKKLDADISLEALAILLTRLNTELAEVKQSNSLMETTLTSMTEEVVGLRAEMEKLQDYALTDSLTGVSNRRAFDETITKLAQESVKTDGTFSWILIISRYSMTLTAIPLVVKHWYRSHHC